jgi:hypothetical protein
MRAGISNAAIESRAATPLNTGLTAILRIQHLKSMAKEQTPPTSKNHTAKRDEKENTANTAQTRKQTCESHNNTHH